MCRELWIFVFFFTIVFKDADCHASDTGFEFVQGVWDESKYTSIEKLTIEPDVVSNWPPGPYSIPKPVDGCPETMPKGWEEGYIDITWQQPHAVLSRTNSTTDQRRNPSTSGKYVDITKKELPYLQSLLIGPYSPYRMTLNFCSKTRNNESLDTETWFNGNYSIYGDKSGCPKGFSSEYITINLDNISKFSYDGYLPQFDIKTGLNQTPDYLKIRLCSHVERDMQETMTSSAEPFILLHSNMLQFTNVTYNCPQIFDTSITEETLYTKLHTNNAELSRLLSFCYYKPNTWQHGRFAVRISATTGKLSQKKEFQRSNDTNTHYDVAEILSNDFSHSVEIHWKMLDVGRTVSLFGIFAPISDWPSTFDTTADYLRCFHSNKKWEFLHFAASVCTYKIGLSLTRYLPIRKVGHVLFMDRGYEGRYFTFMSDSNIMIDSLLSKEVELVVFITNTTLKILEETHCNIDLGMNDYGIDDLQLFASSALPEFPASNARPFHSSWCADVKDRNPFIQVDLNIVIKIEGITIWNMEHIIENITNRSIYKRFLQIGVKAFSVYYGPSERTYTQYNKQIFRINTMYPIDEPQTFMFMFPFRARFVKIHVLEPLTEDLSCLRFELHGCRKIDSKYLKCRSSNSMKHVPALNNSFTNPLHTFENLTENECVGSCVKNVHCSIIKSSHDGYCTHYEGNFNGTWQLANKKTETDVWSAKTCSSDYIEYPLVAYTVISIDENVLQSIKLLMFVSIIKVSTIITSLGYPLNYGGGETYKWLIKFEETKFIKLVFVDVNFTTYQKTEEYPGCYDYLALNEEIHRYDTVSVERFKTYYLDQNTFKRRNGEFQVDNTFNGKMLAVETKYTELIMTFITCHPISKVVNRGNGFRVIVLKEDVPACTSLGYFVRFNEDRYEYCDQPSMTLSSMSYFNIPFVKRTERWGVYRKRGFLRVDLIQFEVICDPETTFAINERKYCNLDMAGFNYYTQSNTLTVTFRTQNPRDIFHLKYTNVYDEVPTTITQKAADIYAIHESIFSEAHLTGDLDMKQLFLSGSYKFHDKIENIPRLVYKACAEKFNKCYSMFSYLGTWDFASGECSIRKQRLVAIRNEEELKLIKYMLRNFKYIIDENSGIFQSAFRHNKTDFYYSYIGLRRKDKGNGSNSFYWENKSTATFKAWAPGESHNGDCTRMGFHLAQNDTTWETHNCLSKSAFYFVCEDYFDKTAKEIRDRSVSHLYTGNVSVTAKGRTCQRWDSQYPHQHHYVDSMFPDRSISDASNFCRDPTKSGLLWCLTVHPSISWARCELDELNEEVRPDQYRGYLDRTETGQKCLKWIDFDHNYCRPVLGNYKYVMYRYFWCYRYHEGTPVNAMCSFKDTASDRCKGLNPSHIGRTNVTASRQSCQRWDMFYTPDDFTRLQFPDSDLKNASNFCRDPTSQGFSWCFTTYPGHQWEICKFERLHDLNNILDDIGNISTPTVFECNDGQLIDFHKRCNGILDCNDFSDEGHCALKNHPLFENSLAMSLKAPESSNYSQQHLHTNISRLNLESIFQCTSQEFVSFISVCDGVIDCDDASDETNCSHVNKENGKCGIDQFSCDGGKCIHVSLVCNFINDCIDASDELCEYPQCSKEEYACGNGQCIPLSLRCDAVPNCIDRTDEHNCESCSSTAFHCDYIRCLPRRVVCDKFPDCTDRSDEQSCDNLKMKYCIDWWNAGYRESGTYLLLDVFSGNQFKVYCGFDRVTSMNEIYTIFQNVDLMKRNGKLIIFTSYLNGKPFDQAIDFFFNTDGNMICTQEAIQSCNPVMQTISVTDDPDFKHVFSYCKCLIITLAIGWEPEIVSVRHCNTSDQLDVDDFDDLLLFDYQYTSNHRAIVWKDTSVNFDDIQLSLGDVTCIQEMFDFKNGDISKDQQQGMSDIEDNSKQSTSCPDGENVLDTTEECTYNIDRSGFITGCRSGAHLENCGKTKCANGYIKCPDSYCIPLKFLCDGDVHCPNAEDESDCGCEDSEREVLIVHEKDEARGPNVEMLVKQLHTPRSIIRRIEYSSYKLSEGIGFKHRMLNVKDKEMKPFENIDRNYECEYKMLANDFLSSIPYTHKHFKRSILFIQKSPLSELVAELIFGDLNENPNISIYRTMESSDVAKEIIENKFQFVIDVRVSNWNILSSLAARYFPIICKESFSTTCPGFYKCSSSKMCLTLDQVCDGVQDCIYGDDEVLCEFTCPVQCICAGFTINCSTFNTTALVSYPKQTRSLSLEENGEKENLLYKDYLNFQFLYKLNVSSCKILEIHPNTFSKLINLRILDLSNNLITKLFPSLFSGLQRLTKLILDGNNHLANLESFSFQHLKSIQNLRITSTKIKTVVADTFAKLNLKILDIRDNNFDFIEEYGFGDLAVEHILFQENVIASFDKGMFTGVSSLKSLHTPAYKYCCVRPSYLPENNCFPQKDEFSSCDDLMRISVLQTMLWLIGLCALLGNILSFIYRLRFDRERLKLGYGIFVTNLAGADFLMGVYLIIISVADAVFRKRYIFMDDYWRNSPWCTLAGVLSTLSSEASVVFLCLITLDRLLVIKYPFGQIRFTTKKAILFSIAAWLFSFLISVFPLLYATYFHDSFYNKSGVCIALPLTRDRPPGWLYSVFIFVVFNFVTFLLIALGQWSIFMDIRNSKRTLQKTQSGRRKDLIIARNLLLVVATDFLCWFPIGFIGLMAMSGRIISGDVYAWIAVFVLPVNSALNPVLYTLTAILGKKNFTPRMSEQTFRTVHTNIGKRFLINKAIIMRRFYTSENTSSSENMYKSLADVIQDSNPLPPGVALKSIYQIAQTLHVLHSSSLIMGKIEEKSIFIQVIDNKVTGNVQLRKEPILCREQTDTCNDMYKFGLLLRMLMRKCKSDVPERTFTNE